MKICLFVVLWATIFFAAGCERELNLGFRTSETDGTDDSTESDSDSETASESELSENASDDPRTGI